MQAVEEASKGPSHLVPFYIILMMQNSNFSNTAYHLLLCIILYLNLAVQLLYTSSPSLKGRTAAAGRKSR